MPRLPAVLRPPSASFLVRAARLVAPVWVASSLVACGESRPAKSAQTEMVPSNSAFESSATKPPIVGDTQASDAVPAGGTPVSGAPGSGPTPGPAPAAPAHTQTAPLPSAPSGAPEPSAKGGAPTRAECTQVLDHYIDLEIKSRPELSSIPPEMLKSMLAQAKQQANAQKGDPCKEEGITRAKYACGMAAKTPEAWKTCMR